MSVIGQRVKEVTYNLIYL